MWIFRGSQKSIAHPLATFVRSSIFIILAGVIAGCGVKGDPIPPERPAEIGTGRPEMGASGGAIEYKPSAIKKNTVDEEAKSEDEDSEERAQ